MKSLWLCSGASSERRRSSPPKLRRSDEAPLQRAMGLIGIGFLSMALCAQAQCSIDWFKVAGGGGTSTNAQYSISGTVGQPDAGPTITNGQFSVVGGFWILPKAVQTEGAPTLTIAPAAPGYCTISWTPGTTGYVLQETWSFSPANWTNSPSGSTNPITRPTSDLARFFRLRKF